MGDAAAQAANKAQALKESMKIPFFYGEKKEDSLTIDKFIQRFENATASMGDLGQVEKGKMFGNYLRGAASVTWNMINETKEVNKEVWADVRAHFMKVFKGDSSTESIIKNITELRQTKDESVSIFFYRCLEETTKLLQTTEAPTDDDLGAEFVALTAAQKTKALDAARRAHRNTIAQALFMSFLKDPIKTDLQKRKPATMIQARDMALELETIEDKIDQKKNAQAKIVALAQQDDAELDGEDLDDATISMINQYRGGRGMQPFRRNFFRGAHQAGGPHRGGTAA